MNTLKINTVNYFVKLTTHYYLVFCRQLQDNRVKVAINYYFGWLFPHLFYVCL